MNSEIVLYALDMGFDYETVRSIVHLKIVQSGIILVLCITVVLLQKSLKSFPSHKGP